MGAGRFSVCRLAFACFYSQELLCRLGREARCGGEVTWTRVFWLAPPTAARASSCAVGYGLREIYEQLTQPNERNEPVKVGH